MSRSSPSLPYMRATTIALGSLTLAVLLTFPLARYVTHSRELLLVAAILMTSRYAGAIAGLLAALVSALGFDWFFDNTPGSFDFTVDGLLRAIAFGSVSGLVAFFERQRRQAIATLEATNKELQSTLKEIKTLRGLLPICSYCKQIKTDIGNWMGIEQYVRLHTEAEFTHGICPSCLRKHFPAVQK